MPHSLGIPLVALMCAMLALNSCDSMSPSPEVPVDLTVRICSQPFAPDWVAVQNDGQSWEHLPAAQEVTFKATSKLGFAYGQSSASVVLYATANELREFVCAPPPVLPWRNWTASVDGVGSEEAFIIGVHGHNGAEGNANGNVLIRVPVGPQVVVAKLFRPRSAPALPDVPLRVIIRRAVDLPDGATLQPFDFSSEQAEPFDSASIFVSGTTGDEVLALNLLNTGFVVNLWSFFRGTPSTAYAVPQALLGPDDYHSYHVRDGLRGLTYFYRGLRDTSVTLGPPLAAPAALELAASPCLRLRATVPSQAEYASFVSVGFVVSYGPRTHATAAVAVSRGYLGGTPSTWQVDIPDLRTGDGECLLNPSSIWGADIEANEGRIAFKFGGNGRGDDVRRWASWPVSSP